MSIEAFIVKNLCSECGVCLNSCPFGAFMKIGESIQVLGDLCRSCEACVDCCQSGAIAFKAK
ncbi:4Fe-4S dicluster domain-containing protein [Heliorestis convoluta]|uniref:4Fe-4S dicluster domain-containing protein n=1 Tax=Heliorestis convoluta TaxID=356322 RepID=A0A5Q2MWM9_9FIRM|nr:4Fe-4S dicluster domain-containing protein [Heliorestis convoluta]QGG46934.1 4Fe-4S dicluster domain-containing protein [Heliorestis convoluta]